MYSYEEELTKGSKLARGIATASAVISGSMLAASCSALVIREADRLSVDPEMPYVNPVHTEQFDSTIEMSAQLGVAALGVAVVGLVVNSAFHAYQRRN